MFKHFGIYDVFYSIWDKKIKVIIGTIVLGIIFSLLLTSLSSGEPNNNIAQKVYLSSQTYYFELDTKDNYYDELSGAAKSVNSLITTDFTAEYVINNLKTKYSEDEIFKMFHVQNEPANWQSVLKSYVSSSLLTDQVSLNIYVETENEEFSKSLLEAYDKYIKEILSPKVGITKVIPMGGINKVSESTLKVNVGISIPKSKIYLIGFSLGFVSTLICLFFFKLFRPTVNFASDFVDYDIRYLGKVEK